LENNLLTIRCDKNQTENQEINYTRREFGFGTFRRSFTLPKIVDAEKISADYKTGILNVKLPKREEAKSRLSREIKVS
jgi:HSP20 family protein